MNIDDYQRQAARTAPDSTGDERLQHAALGIAGEAGEVADLIKKRVHHKRPITDDELAGEIGDVLWGLAELATALGLNLSDIAAANLEKLRARYPEGFVEGGGVREERRDLAWQESITHVETGWGYARRDACPDTQSVVWVAVAPASNAIVWTTYPHDDGVLTPVETDDAPTLGAAFTAAIASAERHGILTPAEAKHARETAPVDLPGETR